MKQTTGFELLPSPANERRGGGLSALPAAALLSAGVMWLLGAPYWAPLSALFCVGAALLGRFRWTTAAALALVAAFCAVFYRQVGAGLLQYANALLHRLTALDGRIHLSFETSQAPQTAWLFAPLSLLSAVAVPEGVRRGGGVLCAVCWTVFAAGCALGFFAAGGLLLLLAGTAALVLSRERAFTLKTAALLLVCALLTAPLALLNVPKSDLPARLERTLHRLRCDTATSTLPEGRLDTLPPRSDSSAPALELTMQTPQKLYLRGFLGERYTGTGWTALENETLADEADRFYRLHEDGFYAQSSIGSSAKSVDIISESTLTVTNLSACSGQQYLPYALVGNNALLPDIIGDNRTAGTRETVTLQYAAGSVPQWYALQSALAAAQDSPSVQTYLTLEQQYRAFAYEQYLQLTPEAAATAKRLLDGHLEGRTLAQLRSAVLDTLEEYLTYDETVTTQCDGEDFLIPGIMEHIERAGIHSGDSISVYPSFSISNKVKGIILQYAKKLGPAIGIKGLYNIQFIVDPEDHVYIIEVNPRSSRTVPFLSKATGYPLADIATLVALGQSLKEQGIDMLYPDEQKRYYAKAPAFSFSKLRGLDAYLSPEMKSTGEAIGYDNNLTHALYKAMQASGMKLENYGTVFVTISDEDKEEALPLIRRFYRLGFNIEATVGTAVFLRQHGIKTRVRAKVDDGSDEILNSIRQGYVTYVINTMDVRCEDVHSGSSQIRRCAVENGVTMLTALDTVRVLLDVLEEITLGISTIDA